MVTGFRELVDIHVSIEVLNRQKVLRTNSTGVSLPVSAVGLVNVSQQGAFIAERLMAINTLQGGTQTSILRWRALGVALHNVPLEVLWDIKAFLTAAAFAGFFQFPFISSRQA